MRDLKANIQNGGGKVTPRSDNTLGGDLLKLLGEMLEIQGWKLNQNSRVSSLGS